MGQRTHKTRASENRTLEAARRVALRGDADSAIAALRQIAQRDPAACPSLAELLAFRGNWTEVIPNAAQLIANPRLVYAGNVFDQMLELLARAGLETGRWSEIREASALARTRITTSGEFRPTERKRLIAGLENLERYSALPPTAHVIQGTLGPNAPSNPADLSEYARAREAPTSIRPDLEADQGAIRQYLLSLAVAFGQEDDAIALYEEDHELPFGADLLFVARALVKKGQLDRAWDCIRINLHRWWPVDRSQVAPTELLTDPVLRSLITPERCELILRTPRGPESGAVLEDAKAPPQMPGAHYAKLPEAVFCVFADYHQFYILDASADPNGLSHLWQEPGAFARRLGVAPGVVGVLTATDATVSVELEVHELAPVAKTDEKGWDHIAEASIEISSGCLVVAGCTASIETAKRIQLKPGVYRVRVCGMLGWESGKGGAEPCHVALWPEPARPPEVLHP